MDPLTAIGLASNILSFIDFSARLLKGAKEVHDSQHGVLEENRSRETIVREMQHMSTRILVSESSEKVDDTSGLHVLARECHELSTELISLLEKIKPKDSGSVTQSLASALRNKIYDSDRAGLEARLNNCRAQLHLELSNLTRTETLEKLESLLQALKLDETKLDRIESQIAQLRESINLAPSSSEAKPMLMKLLAEEEKVFATIAKDRILNRLSFEGMNRRSNMVVETHSNTYAWILEDDPKDKEPSLGYEKDTEVENDQKQPQGIEDVEKVRARDKLRTWLESRSSRDVFHLSGKLGSGKSTLMKHIRASPRTEEKLKKWADNRKLTIANFYFWNIGSDYEKSLQGLYTSLLYQIFSQCPEFISKVWPAHWAKANSAPWLAPKDIEISERDVMQAFSKVIESHDMLQSHCFAFFIDGLDEFQSTMQDDHRDLVKLLCKWAASPTGNIKICVSSREYPSFMDGFSPNLRIRFHDLTRRDMDTYIRDKLAHANAEDSFEDLVSLIMNKADGVFLWVALVVKSLREGLENGLSCSDLTREVDVLPEQLESLYKHILMSLGKSARTKAYQTFAMVAELKKHESYRMSLLAYSFFEEYETGNFFMKSEKTFPMSSLTGTCGKAKAQSTSRKLAGWCKGLVEVYKRDFWVDDPSEEDSPQETPCITAWEDWSMELDFAHRSISDFLESDEVQRQMQPSLRHFDHVDAVLNLIVSDTLYENSTSMYNTSRSAVTTAVILKIMHHYDLAREPYTYLQRFGELMAIGKKKEPTCSNIDYLVPVFQGDGRVGFGIEIRSVGQGAKTVETPDEMGDTDLMDETPSNEGNARDTKRCYISDPFHGMDFLRSYDYTLWHIANSSPSSHDADISLTLACICLDDGVRKSLKVHDQRLKVLESLLERSWVSPDTITNLIVPRYRGIWYESDANPSHLTLWHQVLVKALGARYYPTTQMSSNAVELHGWQSQYDGKVIQLFLRFNADTEFSFEICLNEEEKTLRRDFLLSLGKQGSVLKFTTLGSEAGLEEGWRRPWEESDIGLPSEDGTPARRHFSLRQFIELSQYDNKDKLLLMLDERSKTKVKAESNKSVETTATTGEGSISEDRTSSDDHGHGGSARENFNPKLVNHTRLQLYLQDASQWLMRLKANEYVRLSVAVLTGVILTTLFTHLRERVGSILSP